MATLTLEGDANLLKNSLIEQTYPAKWSNDPSQQRDRKQTAPSFWKATLISKSKTEKTYDISLLIENY